MLRGSVCSHVEDSCDAHRDYSAALTQTQKQDGRGQRDGGGGGNPQQENSGYKNSIVLRANPLLVTSLP